MSEIFAAPKMKLPEVQPTKMADIEDPVVKEQGRRKRREEQAAQGRASTNLSGAPVTYSNTTLGV